MRAVSRGRSMVISLRLVRGNILTWVKPPRFCSFRSGRLFLGHPDFRHESHHIGEDGIKNVCHGKDQKMRTAPALLIASALLFLANGTQAQQVAGAKPAAGTLDLMKSTIIPASDVVFGVGKAAPKSDKEWAAVQDSAVKLTAAVKLLIMQAPAANGANWLKHAKAMGDAADTAAKAALAKNVDAVLDAGDALYSTCEDCHKQYLKK